MASGTISAILEGAAARHAASTAVVDGGRRWTYAELAQRVEARASEWRERGVARGDRVAVLDWNSAAYLECYFAAARLGAVLNPLNPRLAAAELAEILADSGAKLLIASRELSALAEAARAGTALEAVLAGEDEPRAGGSAPPPSPARPQDLAQLYYTSGTTGRPKGVQLTHENVCVHAETAASELALSGNDRWGHFAPLFHLADAWATFAITEQGGVHVVARRFEPDPVLELIEKEKVTVTNLIPTMLKRLVESPRARTARLSSVRLVLSGGAPIAPALVRAILDVFRCEYVQTYGMTETSPYLTLGLLSERARGLPAEELLQRRARTGRSFRAVELEVVDERDQPVPADDRTVGEIRVRGRTVTPGYWNRPEETAAAIRGGWLYTGDLAVIDAEGSVNIVDRKKDMILSGGENIYSVEVENALYEHPAVLETAVIGLPDVDWGEAVHAAVVLRAGTSAGAPELIAFCKRRIAAYKAPRSIEFLPELPKTGSGKIAKAELRERARRRSREVQASPESSRWNAPSGS